MQSSSHRGSTMPRPCLSAWRATFFTALLLSCCPWRWMAPMVSPCRNCLWWDLAGVGRGAIPLPRDGVSEDSKFWSLIPFTCPSFWDCQCDNFHRSPSSQEREAPSLSSQWTWHLWAVPPCTTAAGAGPARPALVPQWAEEQKQRWGRPQDSVEKMPFSESFYLPFHSALVNIT